MENKFVYVVWYAEIVIGHSISFKPKYHMKVFPTYMSALRFVAINKAEKCNAGWQDWRAKDKDNFDYYNTNMLVLELSKHRDLTRIIVTRAPISQEIFRF